MSIANTLARLFPRNDARRRRWTADLHAIRPLFKADRKGVASTSNRATGKGGASGAIVARKG